VSVASAVALIVTTPAPAAAVIDNPDLDSSGDYTFRVEPGDGEIEVTIELALTADKPNRTTASGYYQYFFDGIVLLVPSEVDDLVVSDSEGRPLDWRVVESVDFADDIAIDFGRNLYYRQTIDVVVTFTLPGGEPRSEGLTRINGAYAGFQAWVDPRLEEATVTVITPEGFTDRSVGSDTFSGRQGDEGADGERWFVVTGIDPETYWAGVSLTRDESLVSTELEVGGHRIEVRSWPGDDDWEAFVTENLAVGLPELIDRVGLDWPLRRDLTIVESFTPYLSGYAGWYDLETDEIEIGDELDTHVMFHELSHVWFNGKLFDERWITEGLADEFSAELVDVIGADRPDPPRVLPTEVSAQALNDWTVFTENVDTEEWSYGASWLVTRELGREVGLDGLSEVVRAAAADQISYVGDGEPETEVRRNDWRLYFDLLSNLDGADDETIAALFERWVLTGRQALDLDDRAESRTRYGELVEEGDTWAPPLAVRVAMSGWEFAEADALMTEAEEILDERGRVVDTLSPLGASLPTSLEEGYEGAEDDLDDAADLLAEALDVAEDLVAADDALEGATGPLQWIGAIGADHDDDLAQAIDEFEDGDLDRSADLAAEVDRDVDELSRRGLLRLGVAIALVVGLVALLAVFRRSRRARRSARPVALLPSGEGPAGPLPELTAGELAKPSTAGGGPHDDGVDGQWADDQRADGQWADEGDEAAAGAGSESDDLSRDEVRR
jgi:hypothetical protein